MNKSCFKDCFYSFSHEHVFTLSFLYFLHPHKVPTHPLEPRNPASFPLSIAWVSIVFVFRVLIFVSTFFSLVSSPRPPSTATPHNPLFLFNLTPFYIVLFFSSFFYQSLSLCVANGPFRSTVGAWPVRWKLTSFRRGRARRRTPPKYPLSLSHGQFKCVCVGAQRKRWNNSRNGRGRFFKYDIKRSRRE